MHGIRLIAKLVVAQAMRQPARIVLASLAVIASACAVAWVVSGYEALVSQFDENAAKYLGRYDLIVTAGGGIGETAPEIPSTISEALARDPAVLEVNPISQSRASVTPAKNDGSDAEGLLGKLVGSKPPVNGAPSMDPMIVATRANEGPYEMVDGRWMSGEEAEAREPEAVISRNSAERMGVAVGDKINVTTIANRVTLQIVGILEQAPQAAMSGGPRRGGRGGSGPGRPRREAKSNDTPPQSNRSAANPDGKEQAAPTGSRMGMGIPLSFTQMPAVAAVYVRPSTADLANGYKSKPAVLQIALREGFDVAKFRKSWDDRLAKASTPLRAVDFDSLREGFEHGGSAGQKLSQAYSATALAALAAVFIIFSTLSMGVSERSREFAMLRAIALTRGQIAAIIATESLLLALIGWGGGLLAGWVILNIAAASKPDLFVDGAALGWTCVALTGAAVGSGALGAAILPAWQAMRIRPIDAMGPPQSTPSRRWPLIGLVIGLALVSVAPISVFFLSMEDASRVSMYAVVGYPCLFIGMACLTPAVILACERYLGPLVSRLLWLDPLLVRGQLSSNLWRTLGATLAMASGLALYVSTQTWGYSMLQPFLPGNWLPDAIVGFQPIGVSDQQAAEIGKVPGIVAQGILPLAVEQAPVEWPDEAPSGMGMDNVTVIGIDPQVAFGGNSPRLPLRFVTGSQSDAAHALADENGCLISEDYQMKAGVKVGDILRLNPPNRPGATAEYRIAGVVSLPGWQWFTKFSGVRRHFVRTGGIVFANAQRTRTDFDLGNQTEFFWLDFDGTQPVNKIEASLQKIAERNSGEKFLTAGVGEVTAYRPFARLTATETVREGINRRADGMIWGMSQLPLVTLLITTLAVANTMIASVRARTWDMAILRSIGTTRGELVRLVLVEALLIGIATCLVSLVFGLIAGWCGVGMSRFGGFFGGPPVFIIPWSKLAFGFSIAVGLSLLAAVWPAIKIGSAKPLALLQSGRAAM
jgi:putative ABC transport system permease protein